MDLPLLLLRVGAFSAGVVDAVIGGRGLIQIPMVFSAYPQALPASVFGTSSAAVQYGRRPAIPWRAAALRPPILSLPILVAIYIFLH